MAVHNPEQTKKICTIYFVNEYVLQVVIWLVSVM